MLVWNLFQCPVTVVQPLTKDEVIRVKHVLGASEITANLYCNCVDLYWESCVICSKHLR